MRRPSNWTDFLKVKESVISLDLVARRYGRLPSELLHVTDEWAAWQINLAIALHSVERENEQIRQQRGKGPIAKKFDGINPKDSGSFASPLTLAGARKQ